MSYTINKDVNSHDENINKNIYDKKLEVSCVRSIKAEKLIEIRNGKIIVVTMNRLKNLFYSCRPRHPCSLFLSGALFFNNDLSCKIFLSFPLDKSCWQ